MKLISLITSIIVVRILKTDLSRLPNYPWFPLTNVTKVHNLKNMKKKWLDGVYSKGIPEFAGTYRNSIIKYFLETEPSRR